MSYDLLLMKMQQVFFCKILPQAILKTFFIEFSRISLYNRAKEEMSFVRK